MANARQILSRKATGPRGSEVIMIGPDGSALDAARLMNEHHIGSLLVIDQGKLVGIFTERDIMRRIVAERRDPETTLVGEVMTGTVACAAPHTAYTELCSVMRQKQIRHLPVLDGETVVGMISIGDLNRVDHDEQERTILYLEQFISRA